MKEFVKYYGNPNEDRLNRKLIRREYDKDLVTYVVNVFKSLESTGMIKFLDYSVEYDESKIDYWKYITSRKKKKKKDAKTKYHYIKNNRVFELTMSFRVEVNGEVEFVKRSILLPKKDKHNYYMIKGKRYFLLYQLVDSSTYVVKEGLVFKSLMPIVVNFRHATLTDVNDKEYEITTFYMKMFKRQISVMHFYFSLLGFKKALTYYVVDHIIEPIAPEDADPTDDKHLYIHGNRHIMLKVNRHFFDKFDYVKAMTGMIVECFAPKTTLDDLENKDYWIESLGSLYTKTPHKMLESGHSIINFFERLLDLTSKDSLKISEVNKISIYSVVKWMIMNFVDLRRKNNLDLSTKRLRLNELKCSCKISLIAGRAHMSKSAA